MPWLLRIVGWPNSAHFDGTLVPGRTRPQHQEREFPLRPQLLERIALESNISVVSWRILEA